MEKKLISTDLSKVAVTSEDFVNEAKKGLALSKNIQETAQKLIKSSAVFDKEMERVIEKNKYVFPVGISNSDVYSKTENYCQDIFLAAKSLVNDAGTHINHFPVKENSDENNSDDLEKDIELFRISDRFLIRIPQLPRRLYPNPRWKNETRRVYPTSIYSDILRKKFNDIFDLTAEDLIKFSRKTLCFYFVYGSKDSFIIDTDSHETKPIIDALTINFVGGDSGPMCSIFNTTVISDELLPATYIEILPGLESVLPSSKMIDDCKSVALKLDVAENKKWS